VNVKSEMSKKLLNLPNILGFGLVYVNFKLLQPNISFSRPKTPITTTHTELVCVDQI
jgi:hypothetical protein